MRSSIRIAEAGLGLAILCLAVALAVPWREPVAALGESNHERAAQPSPAGEKPLPVHANPSAIIVMLTGPAVTPTPAAPAPAAPAPVEKKPVDATWLKYVGRSTTTDGKLSFHIKDTRSGRMLRVVEGETIDGLSVVEVADGRIVLGSGDDLLVVTVR